MTRRTSRKSPRISIGLPVYNGEEFLAEAIDSLLAQTYPDFELIICDNASEDDTEAICRAYVEQDPRVRYERQSRNLGAAANYNRTFELARGEFFKWAAHDDVCRPTFLARCVEQLDRPTSEDVAVVYPKSVLIDGRGDFIRNDPDDLSLSSNRPDRRFAHVIEHVSAANSVFGVFRSRLLAGTARIGAYSASDWMLLAEIALHGRIEQIDEVLFERRIHDGASLRAILKRKGSKREQVSWFDTRHGWIKSLVPFDVLTSWVLARSVVRARLPLPEALRTLAVIPRVYWPRLVRFRGGRMKQRLRGRRIGGPTQLTQADHEA